MKDSTFASTMTDVSFNHGPDLSTDRRLKKDQSKILKITFMYA